MKILALDIAVRTGFAFGDADGRPASGSVRLTKTVGAAEEASFNMLAFLRDRFVLDKPDLVFAEGYLNPAGHKSAAAIVMQIGCYFTAAATCRAYGVKFEAAAAATIRKHFIGKANESTRDATKRAVLSRCAALGYLPRSCLDDNQGDALAAWDFAAANHGRAPRPLIMFGAAHATS